MKQWIFLWCFAVVLVVFPIPGMQAGFRRRITGTERLPVQVLLQFIAAGLDTVPVRTVKEIPPKNPADARKNYAKDNNRIKPQKNSGKPLFFRSAKWYNSG